MRHVSYLRKTVTFIKLDFDYKIGRANVDNMTQEMQVSTMTTFWDIILAHVIVCQLGCKKMSNISNKF